MSSSVYQGKVKVYQNQYFIKIKINIILMMCINIQHSDCYCIMVLYYSLIFLAWSLMIFIMPPLKKGAYCFATVGQSVGMSVCRQSVVHSISFDPSTWLVPNLVEGLPSISKWCLLIFRSHVQRSRSNHSSHPTVLSAQYLLNPSLDQYQILWRGCPQWVDDPYRFSGHMFKG